MVTEDAGSPMWDSWKVIPSSASIDEGYESGQCGAAKSTVQYSAELETDPAFGPICLIRHRALFPPTLALRAPSQLVKHAWVASSRSLTHHPDSLSGRSRSQGRKEEISIR